MQKDRAALEAAARAIVRRNYPSATDRDIDMMWEGYAPDAQAALTAYLAHMESEGMVMASAARIAELEATVRELTGV